MYDLLSGLTPEDAQRVQAEALRRNTSSAAMERANMMANRYNPMAIAAMMSNNPEAAAAAKMAAQQAQTQFKPVQLGREGFALPESGDFVPSPIYQDERDATRQDARLRQREMINAREDNLRFLSEAQRQRAEDNARAQAERQQAALQQARELAMQRDATQRWIAQQGNDTRALIAAMGLQGKADAAAAKAAKGKTLPAGEVRKLTDTEGIASSFGDITDSFSDDFAGTPGLAEFQNTLGKYNPFGMGNKYSNQANWWQRYNEWKNQKRNQLFGSALTKTEQDAFDAANIKEGMDPAQIKRNLLQQRRAVAQAYNKQRSRFAGSGYDLEGFPELAIPDAPMPGGMPRLPEGFKPIKELP